MLKGPAGALEGSPFSLGLWCSGVTSIHTTHPLSPSVLSPDLIPKPLRGHREMRADSQPLPGGLSMPPLCLLHPCPLSLGL